MPIVRKLALGLATVTFVTLGVGTWVSAANERRRHDAETIERAGPTKTGESEREPVILLHGWAASRKDMATMRDGFASAGYPTYVGAFAGEDNIVNARAIADIVDTARRETKAEKVHLVGHSMAGLSMRYYIKRMGGAANVRSYVAFGTPQYGFSVACILAETNGGQMCPSSAFLKDLNAGDDTPGNVAYFAYRSTKDTPGITRLDGGACFVELPDVSHFDEPKSPAFLQSILRAVGGTCPGTYTDLAVE
ncbi:hypothetical protein LZC95_07460 [Pendulispora brunnea]|uniref:Uncharacterized protein n=1 Tax=Pendulispora brunnea TaxID=2905690 RepID=A0ABZ2KDI5_9BACT